jgi:hypothetical protein
MAQVKLILRKVTKQGLVVTLMQKELIIQYSQTHIVATRYPSRAIAKKEFNKYRQSNKDLEP